MSSPDTEHLTEQAQRGLEPRYHVEKINDPTGKHDECRFFVLDPQHDPIALAAIARYAQVARAEGYGALADDLTEWVQTLLASAEREPLALPVVACGCSCHTVWGVSHFAPCCGDPS